MDGGDGRDFIYGSGSGPLAYLGRTSEAPPVAPGTEFTRGFTWVTYDAGIDANGLGNYGLEGAGIYTIDGDDGNLIDAGADDDWVRAGSGADVVHGGSGVDNLFGLSGNDVLYGDDGNDFMVGDGVDVSGYVETVPGDRQGNDILVAGIGDDTLIAGGGDDDLYGGADADILLGDASDVRDTPLVNHGNDYLDGGDGNDQLIGGGRDDTLLGGTGDDRLFGDDQPAAVPGTYHGDDFLDGGEGADELVGGGGSDTLIGGTGNDRLFGDDPLLNGQFEGDDFLDGGDGDDQFVGGGGNDTLFGGAGADLMTGSEGDDELDGEDDNDELQGGDGNDRLTGGAGADRLFGEAGADDLDAGDGDDALAGGEGDDILIGGAGADQLFGEAGADDLDAGDGDDVLSGGDGDDILIGAAGNDQLFGDEGNDNLSGGSGIDQLQGNDGDDRLDGGDANDALLGDAGSDVLQGGEGDDQLEGGSDADQLFGGGGVDALFGDAGNDALDGGDGNDQLVGGTGNDLLAGGSGNDRLFGEDGDDRLEGDVGDDVLVGNAGNDTLIGGAGRDSLLGGDGDDTYVFAAGDSGVAAVAESINDLVGQNHLRFTSGITLGGTSVTFELTTGQTMIRFGSDVLFAGGLMSGAYADVSYADGTTYVWQEFLGKTLDFPISQQTTAAGVQVVGGRLSDTLIGTGGGSTFWGGQGSDSITGGAGNNTYVFNRGDGHDSVNELSRVLPTSTVRFGAGIVADDLILSYSGSLLRIGLRGSAADELGLMGFSAANAQASLGIAGFRFADGQTVSYQALLAQRGFALTGSLGDDALVGTSAADTLDSGAGNDTLSGRQGADTYLFGRGFGADIVADQDPQAGAGDRLLLGSGIAAADVIASRYRNDLVLRIAGGADSVRLTDYFVPASADAVELIELDGGARLARADIDAMLLLHAGEPISGAAGNDVLYGTAGADALDGGAGNDTLYGDAGSDTLVGGPGDDLLFGEAGSDTYVFGAQAGNDVIDEAVGGDAGGIDTIRFTDGIKRADVTLSISGNNLVACAPAHGSMLTIRGQFLGTSAANQVERFVFADGEVLLAQAIKDAALAGSTSSESITGFDGDDSISAGYGNDTLFGRGGADVLHGDQGADTVYGEAGDDSLYGDAGSDRLYGGDGNDRLEGGTGRDRLDGGIGNDVYAFGTGQGNDIIVLDAAGTDSVVLAVGITAANVSVHRVSAPAAADLAFGGDSLVVQLNGGTDQLWIANYFAAASPGYIETVRFADGTTWDYAAVTARLVTLGGTVNTQTGTSKANNFAVDHWDDVIANPVPTTGDKVTASVSYRVPATTRDLTLTGKLNLFAVTTPGSDIIRGNDGDNEFDELDDGPGDALYGGKGNDTYRLRASVESPSAGADPASLVSTQIIELASEGIDSVESAYWSAQLPANVENLTALTPNNVDSLSISFWQDNDLAHKFVGNALDNVIDSSAYEESSPSHWWYARRSSGGGLASVATFRLDGGAGADTLIGGSGDDTYVVDNAADVVLELGVLKSGQNVSNDTVETPFETSLETQYPSIENVSLLGAAAVGATGNALANRLDGSKNAAGNRLAGGLGDDTYVVGLGDVVVERAGEGNDTLVVTAAAGGVARLADYPNVENLRLLATAGALTAEGDAAANVLNGSLGNNRLSGQDGDDTIADQYLGDIKMYGGRVAAFDNDVLEGGAGNDVLTSYGGDDTLDGGSGDDRLVVNGWTGANNAVAASAVTLRFGLGAGHDTVQRIAAPLNRYVVELKSGCDLGNVTLSAQGGALAIGLADGSSLTFSSAVDGGTPPSLLADFAVALTFADGTQLDRPGVQALLRTTYRVAPTALDDLLLGTTGNDVVYGIDGNDMVYAYDGDDLVDGGAGNDLLFGAAGADSLFGGAGSDTLSGGSGNDLLAGGAGADVYRFARGFGQDVIDDRLTAPQVSGVDDGSVDTVEFDYSITPAEVAVYRKINGGQNVTGLVLGLPATGDRVELRNSHLAAQPGAVEAVRFADGTQWGLADLTVRLAGEIGSELADALNSSGGPSLLLGFGGNDGLSGSNGDDTLDGGAGFDVMSGGLGDDTYYVDSPLDQIIEAAGGGTDTLVSTTDLTLPANVERLQLAGSAPLRATGNSLNNTLIGNTGANRLDGGGGADAMSGGAGDDRYVVDSTTDTVTESANEGIDTIESSVTLSFPLGANIENLVLTGTGKINGTGNALDNFLQGNTAVNSLAGGDGNDRLDGGGGADSMTGGNGNDTYVVDLATDKTIEAAAGGIDSVESSVTWTLAAEVERLVLTGGGIVNGTGNASNNQLFGNEVANVLDGASGADVLLGLAGNDTLQDTAGNNAFDAGAGADTLKGGTSADLLAGGSGNDTLTLGGGTDVVCFNRGDGADTLVAPLAATGAGERNDTVSLGGIRFAQLALAREGSDLLLKVVGSADSLRMKDWYVSAANQTVVRLQVVVDSTADYAPGSVDLLRSSRLCVLDFTSIVAAFDAAKAANPALADWTPSDATLGLARLSSSDVAAIGATLAYRYAEDGTLATVGYSAAVAALVGAGFGGAPQATSISEPLAAEAAVVAVPDAAPEADSVAPAQLAERTVPGTSPIINDFILRPDVGNTVAFDAPASSDALAASAAANAGETAVPFVVNGAASPSAPAIEVPVAYVLERADAAIPVATPPMSAIIGAPDAPGLQGGAATPTLAQPSTTGNATQASRPAFANAAASLSATTSAPAQPASQERERSVADFVGSAGPAVLAGGHADRGIDQVLDRWFDNAESKSPGIRLSHYDQIVRGELLAQAIGSDANVLRSYANQWQRMHTGLGAYLSEGVADTSGVDSTAAFGLQRAWSGAGTDPLDLAAVAARSGAPMASPLPVFAGLQDGFERL